MRAAISMVLLSVTALAFDPTEHFHSLIPLGADAYELQNKQWKGVMTLMASAESAQFEGMERRTAGQHLALFTEDGRRVSHFPSRVDFRVTATFRANFVEPSPFPMSASRDDQNQYLLDLKFRVVVFHGLTQTVIKPKAVEMIGVPGEMPYDERIYRISVDLADVPLTDRVVFEVHDSEGGRICKFHLDLL